MDNSDKNGSVTPAKNNAAGKTNKKLLKILIPVIAVLLIAAVVITVVLVTGKQQGGAVVVTDENGVPVTDANGEPVTIVPETEIVTGTDANGNIITSVAYKSVTIAVPVTGSDGKAVTDSDGKAVTEIKTVTPTYPDPNTTKNNVVGSSVVAVTDGAGNTGRDEQGNILTTVVPITTIPAADITPAKTEWKLTQGGSAADYISDVMLTKDGGYITANVSNSLDGDFKAYAGQKIGVPFTVLTKYDKNGKQVWEKGVGHPKGIAVIMSLALADDGGFYAVGYGSGFPNLTKKGYYDGVIYRFNADGTAVWCKTFGTSTVDLFYGSAVTSDGGIVAVGSVGNNDGDAASFGGEKLQSRACAVKYSPDGELVWANVLGGNQDSFTDVTVGNDGAIYAVGNFYSGKLFKALGKSDGGVVKLSGGGKYIAAKSIAGSGIESFSCIITASDGGLVISGRSNSMDAEENENSLFKGEMASRGGYDAYIIKLTPSLDISFKTPFRGQNNESLDCIFETEDGNFIAAGYTNSSTRDLKGVTTRGGNDIVIASFDKRGDLLWARSFGGTLDDSAAAICAGADGGYVVAGKTLSKDVDLDAIAPYGGNGMSVGVVVKFPE